MIFFTTRSTDKRDDKIVLRRDVLLLGLLFRGTRTFSGDLFGNAEFTLHTLNLLIIGLEHLFLLSSAVIVDLIRYE